MEIVGREQTSVSDTEEMIAMSQVRMCSQSRSIRALILSS